VCVLSSYFRLGWVPHKTILGITVASSMQAGCPSCYLTNTAKVLKGRILQQQHPFSGPLPGTTRVNWYQTDNHARTPPLTFLQAKDVFLLPYQQRQSTEGTSNICTLVKIMLLPPPRRRLCFRCGLFVCLSVGLLANL